MEVDSGSVVRLRRDATRGIHDVRLVRDIHDAIVTPVVR